MPVVRCRLAASRKRPFVQLTRYGRNWADNGQSAFNSKATKADLPIT